MAIVNNDDQLPRGGPGPVPGDPAIPVLLSLALRSYGRAIRTALSAAGMDDLPGSGSWIVGQLARSPATISELARPLATTKQATSRLAETLADRGYLAAERDSKDRRLVRLHLTTRGRRAAEVVAQAVDGQDAALAGADASSLRRALRVLAGLGGPIDS